MRTTTLFVVSVSALLVCLGYCNAGTEEKSNNYKQGLAKPDRLGKPLLPLLPGRHVARSELGEVAVAVAVPVTLAVAREWVIDPTKRASHAQGLWRGSRTGRWRSQRWARWLRVSRGQRPAGYGIRVIVHLCCIAGCRRATAHQKDTERYCARPPRRMNSRQVISLWVI